MGTWGEGPFDNDAAADLVAGLMRRVTVVLDEGALAHAEGAEGDKPHPPTYYGEARAAAQFIMLAHGTDILGGPPIANVLKLLAQMRSDTEWLAGWKQPRKVAERLEAEMTAVIMLVHACKGCRRDKSKLAELDAIVRQAKGVPVPRRRKFRIKRVRKGRGLLAKRATRRLHTKGKGAAA